MSAPSTNGGAGRLGSWLGATGGVPARDYSDSSLQQAVLLGLQRRRQRRMGVSVTGAVAGAVVVALLGMRLGKLPETRAEVVAFRVLPGNGMGQVGAYVAPTANAPLELKFTEGSVIELEPGARARVAATTSRGATVLLETGRADVNVVHRKNAEWTVMAGPYSVRVHGTSFSVEFDPKSQLFELVMRSGVVSVEGPGISRPVEIRGAQRFAHRAGLGSESQDVSPPQARSSSVTSDAPTAESVAGDNAASEVMGARAHVTVAPSWEAQVRRGQYAAVLRDAEERGFSKVLAVAGPTELMALANAARFTGRIELGRDAYKAIRLRFAGSSSSAAAAFLLGRLFEASAPAESRRWYELYEQESPGGALASEALGRRMVLSQTVGSHAEVESIASDYLRRFPDGSYAGVARKIVAP